MKMIYVVQGTSTGCNGNIIHWADSAFTDEQEAIKRCDRMNRSMKNDPNYLAYVTGPIPYESKAQEIYNKVSYFFYSVLNKALNVSLLYLKGEQKWEKEEDLLKMIKEMILIG